MFGRTIGNLTVQTCTNAGCNTIFTQTGQQHTSNAAAWTYIGLAVPANTQWIQWTATRGTSFTGDISIDTVVVGQGPVPSTSAPTAAPTLPQCAPVVEGAVFSVTAAAPLATCAGGGGLASAAQGTCYTTTSGSCITNGIVILQFARVHETQTYSYCRFQAPVSTEITSAVPSLFCGVAACSSTGHFPFRSTRIISC